MAESLLRDWEVRNAFFFPVPLPHPKVEGGGETYPFIRAMTVNYGHHGHFYLIYWPLQVTWPQPKSRGRNKFLLVSGGSCKPPAKESTGRREESGTILLYCLGLGPGVGTLGTRTLVALPVQRQKAGGLLQRAGLTVAPNLQGLWWCVSAGT